MQANIRHITKLLIAIIIVVVPFFFFGQQIILSYDKIMFILFDNFTKIVCNFFFFFEFYIHCNVNKENYAAIINKYNINKYYRTLKTMKI